MSFGGFLQRQRASSEDTLGSQYHSVVIYHSTQFLGAHTACHTLDPLPGNTRGSRQECCSQALHVLVGETDLQTQQPVGDRDSASVLREHRRGPAQWALLEPEKASWMGHEQCYTAKSKDIDKTQSHKSLSSVIPGLPWLTDERSGRA